MVNKKTKKIVYFSFGVFFVCIITLLLLYFLMDKKVYNTKLTLSKYNINQNLDLEIEEQDEYKKQEQIQAVFYFEANQNVKLNFDIQEKNSKKNILNGNLNIKEGEGKRYINIPSSLLAGSYELLIKEDDKVLEKKDFIIKED